MAGLTEADRPKTEAEMVRWLVANGVDKEEAKFVAGISFGSTAGDLVEVTHAVVEQE